MCERRWMRRIGDKTLFLKAAGTYLLLLLKPLLVNYCIRRG